MYFERLYLSCACIAHTTKAKFFYCTSFLRASKSAVVFLYIISLHNFHWYWVCLKTTASKTSTKSKVHKLKCDKICLYTTISLPLNGLESERLNVCTYVFSCFSACVFTVFTFSLTFKLFVACIVLYDIIGHIDSSI